MLTPQRSGRGSGYLKSLAAGPNGSVPLRWYRPVFSEPKSAPSPTLVWAHGGGFFAGGVDQPEAHDVAVALAVKGVTVVTVDYRLAPLPGLSWLFRGADSPRGRFPLPMEDILVALREVSRQSEGGLIVGGASAGACLAASAALRTLKMDLNLRGVILAYGFFHALHPRSAAIQGRVRGHRRFTHAPWVLNALNRNYAGSATALTDRFAFPGGHDVSGFPDTLMINADRDSMRASGDLFAAELRGAGADVEHHILAESRHAFLNRPRIDDFRTAIELMASWCRD